MKTLNIKLLKIKKNSMNFIYLLDALMFLYIIKLFFGIRKDVKTLQKYPEFLKERLRD